MMDSATMDDRREVFENDTEELPVDDLEYSSNTNSNESGIDETNFKTSREESVKRFSRSAEEEGSSISFQDLLNNLNAKKVVRSSLLSHVEVEPDTKRLLLKVDRSNIRSKYGFDSERQAYLYPEEALYLLDLGKVEIFCGHVSLSVQRARSLLLVPQRKDGEDKLSNCTTEEYLVYKHLSRSGYSLYRYNKQVASASGTQTSTDEMMTEVAEEETDTVEMEEDDDIIEVENSRGNLKRKLSSSDSESEELLEDVDEIMEDDDDEYPKVGGSFMDPTSAGTSAAGTSSGYIVDEDDSDIEIVDEVIYSHGGVEIQEISHSVGCPEEIPSEQAPSTSKEPDISQVLVDLVSSEDEEEESVAAFGKRVWSKFIPNSKVIFKQPPSSLLPDTISASDKIYELDLKDKSDVSDLELEFLVDEVSLNDDEHGMSSSCAKSWKEWRQNMFREARNVINDSLLASTDCINGDAAAEKLCLWSEPQTESKLAAPVANTIVFEMYDPCVPRFSRLKAFEGKPLYYVSITRHDDRIPEFAMVGSTIDGVPLLTAVVCDNGDNEVVFMTTDRSPLNSLF